MIFSLLSRSEQISIENNSDDKRINNLDFIRAMAILMVVLYHTIKMVFPENDFDLFFEIGSYGVDLFFVLSGYLIGGLYWTEFKKTGTVIKHNFILRRIFRTLPPYFATLFISYFIVLKMRNEPFDFGYLIFIQNYYNFIPFFKVSWSLCVEEHFYLFIPFILQLMHKYRAKWVILLLIMLSFISPLCRILVANRLHETDFWYFHTATHFRFEGLILGVLGAYLNIYFNELILRIGRYLYFILLITIFFLFSIPFLPIVFMYTFGLMILSVLFFFLVISAAKSVKSLWLADINLIKNIALSSYSIYLTHPLVINFFNSINMKLKLNDYLIWSITTLMIFVLGYLFYFLIEKTALNLRNKLVPKKW